MKLSQLILAAHEAMEQHGDIEVRHDDSELRLERAFAGKPHPCVKDQTPVLWLRFERELPRCR